ncbi:unnamed protein product, partial [Notodromas monacha]
MGNEIITVTTSACSLRPLRPGTFCDTCWTRCAGNASLSGETIQTQPSVVPSAISAPIDIESPKRKRHQSEFTGGSPSQASSNFWSAAAKDDLHMWNSEDNVASSHAEGSSTKRPGNELHDDGRILCTCWCQGWAEIHIRRPTGSTSWAMKIQNSAIRSSSLCNDRVLGDIMSHLLPSLRERAIDTDLDSVIQSVEEKDVNVSVGSVKSDLLDADPVNSSRDSVTPKFSAAQNGMSVGSKLKGETPSSRSSLEVDNATALLQGIEEEDRDRSASISNSQDSSAAVENALSKSQTNLVSVSKLLSDGHTGSMPDSLYTACSNKSAEASPVRKSAPGSPEMQHEDSAGLLVPTSSRVLQHRNSLQTTMLGVKPLGIPSSETAFRERSRTVSHAGQVGRPRGSVLLSRTGSTNTLGSGSKDPGERAGINPKFVFLQLFYGGHLRASGDVDKNDESEPLLLPRTREVERSIKNLDRIYPYETHKIGIIYIGRNQLDAGRDSEKEILSNDFGSPRYMEFIQGLGEIISLSDIDTRTTFLGGLDTGGLDGEFAVTWRDELMQVIFHIATLMPKSESDPNCNNKKKHIGNDFVLIVYNESGRPYNTSIVKGQVIYSWIEIQPLPHGCNKILVHARPESDVNVSVGSVKSDLLDADPVNSSRDSVTPKFSAAQNGMSVGSKLKGETPSSRSSLEVDNATALLQGIEEEDRDRSASISNSQDSSAAVENALSKSQTNLVSVSKLLSDGHTGSMPDSLYTACSNKSAEASPVRKSAPGSPEMQHEDSAGLLVPTSSRVLQHRNSLQTTMLGVKPLGIPSSETAFRERSRTVSHAGQVGRPRGSVLLSRTGSTNTLGSGSKDPGERAGINPKFVFLQLFYGGHLRASGDVDKNDESEPLLLPRTR